MVKVNEAEVTIVPFDPDKHDWKVVQKVAYLGNTEPVQDALLLQLFNLRLMVPLLMSSLAVGISTSLWYLGILAFLSQCLGFYLYNMEYVVKYQLFSTYADYNEKFTKFWTTSPNSLWVMEYQGNIIGTIGLKLDDKYEWEITRVGVKKNYRGNKLAKLLLGTAFNHSKQNGYKTITLSVSEVYGHVACKLYTKMGFKVSEIFCMPIPHFPVLPLVPPSKMVSMKKDI
ncbi:unnamed protein product [Owenia fusiformis]|uniref:N-acetyltransferase domain-containing protein n=1 Tax=Owenia fusiformis TaxID=6347 RepID=A0A8J1T774_OWEFU|nr:unnamed protein product [Owenia fusiformis]